MGKKSKKKGASKKKQAGGKKQASKVKDDVNSDQEILRVLSSVETRPSKIHGKGVFLVKTDMQRDTHFKTKNQRLAALWINKFMKMNSPMLPPWKDFLLGQEATAAALYNNQLLDDNREVLAGLQKCWLDYVESENSLANTWIFYERKDSNKLDSMVESAQVKFCKDVSEGEELLRSYGHEWLSIEYSNLVELTSHVMAFAKRNGAPFSAVRVLVSMKTLEVAFVRLVDDEGGETLGAIGDELWVASLGDITDWIAILEYLALTVGKGEPKFDVAWGTSLGMLKLLYNHVPAMKYYY